MNKIYSTTTVSESLFNKAGGSQATTLLKPRIQHKYFPNFSKFFREELWATTSKYILSKQLRVLSTKHCNCLSRYKVTSI